MTRSTISGSERYSAVERVCPRLHPANRLLHLSDSQLVGNADDLAGRGPANQLKDLI